MKLYACDRCDKLVVEDEIHFVKIETDLHLETTDKIMELEFCDKCYNGIISFCSHQQFGGWREFFRNENNNH